MTTHAEKVARGRRIALERGSEIRQKYEAGTSTKELAAEYGLSNGTIWRTIRANGGEMRGSNPNVRRGKAIVADRGPEIAADYANGDTLQQVADRYGITLSTVAKVVRANGGQVRKPGYGANPDAMRGDLNHGWKGGTYIKQGYRHVLLAPDHPLREMAGAKGYAPEHRVVMAEMVKRPLLPSESVHHIDGDRLNNDPANLQLRTGQHGRGSHWRCADCGSQNVTASPL